MKIALAADHAGFDLKQHLIDVVRGLGHQTVDAGPFHYDPVDDYPDFAEALGRAVQRREVERGILVCGSGVGASVAANKLHGVRAGLAHDTYSAHQGVEHDDMNVLCLGARVTGIAVALELVSAFLAEIGRAHV